MIKKITFLFLFATYSLIAQTVNVYNMQYIDGTTIPLGGNIVIEHDGSSRVQFTVSVDNPSGIEGTLTIYGKRNSVDSPFQLGGSETVFDGNTYFLSSRDLTLQGNNFFATGGTLYAEFRSIGGVAYQSGNYNIIVNGGGNGGNSGNGDDTPPITRNQIRPGTQYLHSGNQNPELIYGRTPSGGNGSYSIVWQIRVGPGWYPLTGATEEDYFPSTPKIGSLEVYRRKVSSGNAVSFSNLHILDYREPSTENEISADRNVIEVGEEVQFSATLLTGTGRGGINWLRSIDKYNFGGGGRPDFCWRTRTRPHCYPTPSQNTYYKRQADFLDGTSITSNTVFVRVLLNNNHILYNSFSCKIEGSTPIGEYGEGSYDYRWYKRAIGGNWTLINGENNKDYFPPTCYPTATTQYKRVVNSYLDNTLSVDLGYSSNFIEIEENPFEGGKGLRPILYPNPTSSNFVNIRVSEIEKINLNKKVLISIYDFSGIEILKFYKEPNENGIIENIDVSILEQGIYLIKVVSGKEVNYDRLLVK